MLAGPRLDVPVPTGHLFLQIGCTFAPRRSEAQREHALHPTLEGSDLSVFARSAFSGWARGSSQIGGHAPGKKGYTKSGCCLLTLFHV